MPYKDPEKKKAYDKKYREENREKISEQQKEYREENREKISEQQKEYREKNKEILLIYNQNYRKNNKDKQSVWNKRARKKLKEKPKLTKEQYFQQFSNTFKTCTKCNLKQKQLNFPFSKETGKTKSICKKCTNLRHRHYLKKNGKNREYYVKHRKKIKARRKNYYLNNKEKANKCKSNWAKKKLKTDPTFRLIRNLRRRMHNALKGKYRDKTTEKLLGCSFEEVKKHIESLWLSEMSWENYGLHGWHVDHIIPVSSFNLIDLEEQKRCFHYTNLQPLWAKENLKKGSKILSPHKTINFPQNTSDTPALSETLSSPISLTNT